MSSEKKRWKRKQAGIMMAVVCCATGRIMHDVHIPGALRILPSGALLTLLAVVRSRSTPSLSTAGSPTLAAACTKHLTWLAGCDIVESVFQNLCSIGTDSGC
jgi:hypothetical protein